MILLLKIVLFAILEKALIILIGNIENVNSVILKKFKYDTIFIKIAFYKNFEIIMHVLKT